LPGTYIYKKTLVNAFLSKLLDCTNQQFQILIHIYYKTI